MGTLTGFEQHLPGSLWTFLKVTASPTLDTEEDSWER